METKIINQVKNVFLGREEIVVELVSSGNPSFDDVVKAVGKDEALTVVKSIKGNFGTNVFRGKVYVYDSEEAKKNVEKEKKVKGGEAKAAPAPVAEAPVEEKKEEKVEEVKDEVKE